MKTFVGANLVNCLDNWKNITDNHAVLNWIREGITLPLISDISPSHHNNRQFSLFALSAMCRRSDIAPKMGFYRDQIEFIADEKMKVPVTFFGIKNDADRHGMEVKIDPAEIPETDPVETVRLYLARTNNNIITRQSVFVTLNDTGKGTSSSTVSQIILRKSIQDAGLSEEFTARCFRPTAVSAAVKLKGGVPVQTARVIGRWKSQEVVFERYLYPMTSGSATQKMFSVHLLILIDYKIR